MSKYTDLQEQPKKQKAESYRAINRDSQPFSLGDLATMLSHIFKLEFLYAKKRKQKDEQENRKI
jgi:hypothetical protein